MDFRRKTIKSYTIRIITILIITAIIILVAIKIRPSAEDNAGQFKIKYDLTLWYYDESLSSYLNTLSDEYFKASGLRVNTVPVPSLEFFDNINKLSIEGDNAPDLYIIDSTKLENAYLSSLSKPVDDEEINSENFLKKSIDAATYKGKLVAYPFFYNVAFFAYNTEISEIPGYISDIKDKYYKPEESETGNEEYDAIKEYLEAHPEEETTGVAVEKNKNQVFGFDLSNLLYNSFFIGNYINLGGEYGDDASSFDLSDTKYTEALNFLQELGDVLDIDIKLNDYKTIERNFIENKIKMAVFDCSSLTRLYGSGVDFDIKKIPDLTADLKSRTMSQSSVICVNPNSKSSSDAEALAKYISFTDNEKLFSNYGLMSAQNKSYENKDLEIIQNIYEESFSLPKLIETENIWENINTMLTSVWEGEDIERCQSKLNVAIYIALSTRTEQEDK